jgi:hypothetical protein
LRTAQLRRDFGKVTRMAALRVMPSSIRFWMAAIAASPTLATATRCFQDSGEMRDFTM